MKAKEYIEGLTMKLSKYFDIEQNYTYNSITFDLFAKSFIRNERYIASKKFTIYAIENNEYVFVKTVGKLQNKELMEFTHHLLRATKDYVVPHREHMSTVITGVVVAKEGVEDGLEKIIKKFNYMKSFAFGFKGWVYIRLLVVDLSKGEVICNKRGGEVKKFYQVNL